MDRKSVARGTVAAVRRAAATMARASGCSLSASTAAASAQQLVVVAVDRGHAA